MLDVFSLQINRLAERCRLAAVPGDRAYACGRRYAPAERDGDGSLWVCQVEEHMALARFDFALKNPATVRLSDFTLPAMAFFESVGATVHASGQKISLAAETLYSNADAADGESAALHEGERQRGVLLLLDSADRLWGTVDRPRISGVTGVRDALLILRQLDHCPITAYPELARLYYRGVAGELYAVFADAICREAPDVAMHPYDRHGIREIVQYLREHPAEDTELSALAQMANMSVSKLKYTFQAATGKTIRNFRNDVKGETACRLLDETDLPISEIAERLGFGAPGSFSRFFRSQYHMAPNDYRRRGGRP